MEPEHHHVTGLVMNSRRSPVTYGVDGRPPRGLPGVSTERDRTVQSRTFHLSKRPVLDMHASMHTYIYKQLYTGPKT